MIGFREDEGKVRKSSMNNSLKRQVALLRAMQEMRSEMDRVWKDFFEKNPAEKEEVVRRWLEERLRSPQNSEDQDKGILITAQNAQRKKPGRELR